LGHALFAEENEKAPQEARQGTQFAPRLGEVYSMDPVLRHCRDAKRAAAIHEVEVFIPVATLVSDRD